MGRYPDTGGDRHGGDRHQRNGRRDDSRGSPRRHGGGYDARGGYSSRNDSRDRRGQHKAPSHRNDYHSGGNYDRHRDRDHRDDKDRDHGRAGHDRPRYPAKHSPKGHGHGRGRSRSRSRSYRSDHHGRRGGAVGGGGEGQASPVVARKGGGGSSSSSAPKKKKKKNNDDSSSGTDDDEIIHFDWKADMLLNSRYELNSLAGDGTFGRVVMARDKQTDREVAIKIIRDVPRYMENAQIEAQILKDIHKADPDGKYGNSIMYDTFTHDSKFFCLVLEPLGTSLYDFLKENEYRGYWLQDIRDYARQCMMALAFLHDTLHLTHTDLKPENVLLHSTQPARPSSFPREAEWLKEHRPPSGGQGLKPYMRPVSSAIKLIDFGNATYAEEQHTSTINTRQYRSPEVLLSCGWNELSDHWSIGCILMELYTGSQLFDTHEEMEHLAMLERIIGPLPACMMESASKSAKEKWFTQQGGRCRLAWPDRASSSSSERHVMARRLLKKQVPSEHSGLTDFVGDLLMLEPRNRKSAASMLAHPFLEESFQD